MRRYSPTLVEHFSNPRNLGPLLRPDATAEAANPCCGDRLHLEVRLLDGRITECGYLAHGCAATIATGSLLTEAITGKALDELGQLDEAWVTSLAGDLQPSQRHCAALGKDVLHALARQCPTPSTKGVHV